MYICLCNVVRAQDIENAVADGETTFASLQQRLHVSVSCGACREEAEQYFEQLKKQHSFPTLS